MPVTTTSTATSTSTIPTKSADKQGFNGLSADDFFKLLIAQLQNQDPTEPTSNQELLQQISTIRGVQANSEISTTLKELTKTLGAQNSIDGQRLSVAASFIGKSVTLSDDQLGVVERAYLEDGKSIVVVNGQPQPLANVSSVTTPESLLGRTVQATTTQNGKTVQVVGRIGEVFQNNGVTFVTLSRVATEGANQGQVVPAENVPFDAVKRILSFESFLGKRVTAVDTLGNQVTGKVEASPELINGQRGYMINGLPVPAANILTIEG